MDGAIINILVNAGDTVTKGQTLLILEAMKIQQQIKSDVDGVVNEIVGQVGQQVKKRQLVCCPIMLIPSVCPQISTLTWF